MEICYPIQIWRQKLTTKYFDEQNNNIKLSTDLCINIIFKNVLIRI